MTRGFLLLLETSLPWWSVLPFAVLLSCIAVLPLLPATHHWWERNRNRLLVALGLGLPVAVWMGLTLGSAVVVHALVEYGQFIILLLSLYIVSGGIHLAGDIEATPRTNTIFLGVGAVLASFTGTTSAAMLLVRPLLKTNSERRHTTHTVVFLIFIVANSGGLLTPLGDPPLFIGMLRGVPFLWTFNLVVEWAFVNAMLLATYWAVDRVHYARETSADIAWDHENRTPLRLLGSHQLAFLLMVVLAVALVPSVDLHALETGHGGWGAWVPWRELVMLSAAGLSLTFGSRQVRSQLNQFRWGPILEVAALFIGIFLTMIPALEVLGKAAPHLPLNEVSFFLFTGGLSAILDNAPTYATFFEMAQSLGATMPEATLVAGVPVEYLTAISLGAVFCGAITYIGNGPNFMVRSVAVDSGIDMPSFGGYVVEAFRYLVPILAAMCCLFVADQWWATLIGAVITLGLLVRVWAMAHRARPAPVLPG